MVDQILANGEKRECTPEFWDGNAGERISAHLKDLLES